MNADPGPRIIQESFAIIDREMPAEIRAGMPDWAYQAARRMVHATADFEFARLLRWSDDLYPAVRAALDDGAEIVTDTEMVRTGIASAASTRGVRIRCHLNDPEAFVVAAEHSLTRSAAGIRRAAMTTNRPLVVIGNAPTALDEAMRCVENGWRPAAIVGMPVGFVGVLEAKARLLHQTRVPFLTCEGRKGGSAVAAAAVNALILASPLP